MAALDKDGISTALWFLFLVIVAIVSFRWFVLYIAYTTGIFLFQAILHYISRGKTISYTIGTASGFGVVAAVLHVCITYLNK